MMVTSAYIVATIQVWHYMKLLLRCIFTLPVPKPALQKKTSGNPKSVQLLCSSSHVTKVWNLWLPSHSMIAAISTSTGNADMKVRSSNTLTLMKKTKQTQIAKKKCLKFQQRRKSSPPAVGNIPRKTKLWEKQRNIHHSISFNSHYVQSLSIKVCAYSKFIRLEDLTWMNLQD